MSVLRITRFKVRPQDADRMLELRSELIDRVREEAPGLRRTYLGQVDAETWLDLWLWDSRESLQSAVDAQLPEAAAAFSVTSDVTGEVATLVHPVI